MRKTMTKCFVLFITISMVLAGCSKKATTMKAGEYTVETKGMKPMKLKVTLSESEVTKIEILEEDETKGIADEALEDFPQRIIESQDLTLDVVSGATITSNAIIDGVSEAITQAGGDPKSFGAVSGEISFKAGVYQGVAEGHNAKINVEIEVSDKEILNIEIKDNGETAHLAELPFETIPKQIIEEQSLNVDTVTGATVTSMGVKNAVKDAVKNAGADPRHLNKPSTKAVSTEVKELTADVVVVGGGSGGLSAALTSNQKGKDVIILEKNATYGGHTALSGGYTLVTGSQVQKDLGVTNDTTESAFNDIMANGANHSDPEMLKLFVDNMGKATDWTKDYVGAGIPEQLTPLAENEIDRAMIYEGGGKGIVDALVSKLNETDVKQYLDTRAEELIVEDGKVTGVVAKAKDGTTYNIKAESVVLATGGHGARRDLLGDYVDNYVYYGAALASGDGIDLGLQANADTKDMSFVERFENGVTWKPGIAKSTFAGSMAAWDTAGILVDKNGNRVVNERGIGPDIIKVQDQQDGARLFMVLDEASFQAFKAKIGNYGISEELLDEWFALDGKETPYFVKGDDLNTVAKKLDIDADALKVTIERYNEFVENGVDKDFGRDPKYMTQKFEDGPFYIIEQVPRYATTLGGLLVNDNLEVINKEGNAISGLYAVGDTAAGVRGDDSISGSDVAWAITSGYLIGEIVSK